MTDLDKLAERLRRFLFDPPVQMFHGQYPMERRAKSDWFWTVAAARKAVKRIYAGRDGWWFQIMKNGKEVWSSDHEIASLRALSMMKAGNTGETGLSSTDGECAR